MPYRLLAKAATRATGRLGWARGAIGALLGLALAGTLGLAINGALFPAGQAGVMPFMIAPMGAAAVLIFAVPASPLAQPWSVVGGNLLSTLVGLAIHALLPVQPWSGALAVALAIAVMSLARCLHPPGGACALLACLAPGPAGPLLGALLANVGGLVAGGWLWNNLTGHAWPHHVRAVAGPPAYTMDDLDAVLEEWDEVLDVSREDLDALFRAVEARVSTRR
ncbi:HPP family protein [Novosphingobium bradum]|uniref:HPP family protein n=1 Tax=Novosphingobium bradum TaxID=1737444 RepID=A0ABV7IQY5_9SPHN